MKSDSKGVISQSIADLTSYGGFWFWFVLRFLTSISAAFASQLRPLTEIERTIAAWPPVIPVDKWFERFFLSPWLRWDTVWFQRILVEGYRSDNGTSAFHPLFPWSAKPLFWAEIHPTLSLLVVSGIASLLFLILLERMARREMGVLEARFGVILFLTFPVALSLFTPYTEGLYLFWVVMSFTLIKDKKWGWLAGLSAGMATLTRQQGLFLVVPLAWEIWEESSCHLRMFMANWRKWITIGFIPAFYAGWIIFRTFFIGEKFRRLQA